MRRTYLIALLVLCALPAGSVTVGAAPLDPFRPEHPMVMGRGGSFTAAATGYNSFFHNPAGFARRSEFTLASATGWVFMDRSLLPLIRAVIASRGNGVFSGADADVLNGLRDDLVVLEEWITSSDPADIQSILQTASGNGGATFGAGDDLAAVLAAAGSEDPLEFLQAFEAAASAADSPAPGYPTGVVASIVAQAEDGLPRGYARAGATIGLGYVGNGLGLGVFAGAQTALDGGSVLQAHGTAFNTVAFVGGLGLTFGSLHMGVSVRPTIFGYTRLGAAPVVGSYLAGSDVDLAAMFTNTVYYGSGLAVDAGLLWERRSLSVGLAARDLMGMRIAYRKADFPTYYRSLMAASLPVGSELTADETEAAWAIPMKLNAGVQYHPNLGVLSFLVDPVFSVDLLDLTSVVRAWQADESVTGAHLLSMLNVGSEVRLLRFLSLRGGYYGGYLAGGLGLKIFFLDLNAAIAADLRRDASGAWGFSEVGGSLEVAIRF